MSARSTRAAVAAVGLAVLAATGGLPATAAESPRPSDAAVTAAIRRALDYVYRSASVAANFHEHGDDYVWCFVTIARTARDNDLARAARTMGRERARQWRREHRVIPMNAMADEVSDMVSGALGADLLRVTDERFKGQLRRAARRFTAADYLRFDPAIGPPPQFDLFTDALIVTYFGDAYRIRLGAPYRDVVRWLPRMRPYAPSTRRSPTRSTR